MSNKDGEGWEWTNFYWCSNWQFQKTNNILDVPWPLGPINLKTAANWWEFYSDDLDIINLNGERYGIDGTENIYGDYDFSLQDYLL